jgi:EmrB/QacA subfamily drug resistance transporter
VFRIPHHAPARHRPPGDQPADRRPWAPLLLLSLAQFMVVLDVTVVNVALPSIDADLHFAADDLQWVVTAYVLFTGGLLLLGGRISDLVGRRPVFLTGLIIFTASSLASGLAGSSAALIAARAAQGLGAALLTPAALSIITTTYSGAQLGTALTTWGAVASAGAAAGMLFGGMLTTWVGWESVFLINVPIGIALAIGTLHMIERSPRARPARARFDLPGATLALAGLVLLVLALEGTGEHGWGSARTVGLFAGSAALLAAFTLVERRVPQPLVDPRTWRTPRLTAGAALMLGGTALLVGGFFLNSLYLQTVLGASALETGLAFLPIAIAIGAAAHGAGHLLAHVGTRGVAVAGLLLMAAGAAVLAAAPAEAGYVVDLLPGFIPFGFGVGLVLPAANVTAMADMHASRAGLASGLMSTAHEVGAALGVALLSAIAAPDGAGFARGYEDGFVVAAAIAAAMAAAALALVPHVRPAAGARIAIHQLSARPVPRSSDLAMLRGSAGTTSESRSNSSVPGWPPARMAASATSTS